jgi:hypothetical protein
MRRATAIDVRELLMLRFERLARMLHLDRLFRTRGRAYAFNDCFRDFDKVEVVRRIFGDKTKEVLANLRVEFTWMRSYMWVSGIDGHLTVSSYYLNNGDRIDVYLDLIHELVHVKQFLDGKELFDTEYSYIDRPTEIEAYKYAVEEAKRLGLSDERICMYLKTEWMSFEDLRRLANFLNIKCVSTRQQM